MAKIRAKNIDIHPTAEIADSVTIECESFTLGPFSRIGENVRIKCREFSAGAYLYMTQGVEVGRGGCTGPNSKVTIGDHVGIFENTVINPSEPVHIGDNVGIGCDVQIWTHGAWLDVLQGFPAGFAGVHIGNDVWLPARSIVLPGVSIGDNTVITICSVINRDIPAGSLAGGNPAQVIKANKYPMQLSIQKRVDIVRGLASRWAELVVAKGYTCAAQVSETLVNVESCRIELYSDSQHVHAFLSIALERGGQTTVEICEDGASDATWRFVDDFVDFLRRNGLKIYTLGRPFRSLAPQYMPK